MMMMECRTIELAKRLVWNGAAIGVTILLVLCVVNVSKADEVVFETDGQIVVDQSGLSPDSKKIIVGRVDSFKTNSVDQFFVVDVERRKVVAQMSINGSTNNRFYNEHFSWDKASENVFFISSDMHGKKEKWSIKKFNIKTGRQKNLFESKEIIQNYALNEDVEKLAYVSWVSEDDMSLKLYDFKSKREVFVSDHVFGGSSVLWLNDRSLAFQKNNFLYKYDIVSNKVEKLFSLGGDGVNYESSFFLRKDILYVVVAVDGAEASVAGRVTTRDFWRYGITEGQSEKIATFVGANEVGMGADFLLVLFYFDGKLKEVPYGRGRVVMRYDVDTKTLKPILGGYVGIHTPIPIDEKKFIVLDNLKRLILKEY